MAFRIKRQESTGSALRRIASEQTAKAVEGLQARELSPAEKVHQLRRRCKKLRGLLRLFRPALGETYSAENAFLRDTAQALSSARDSQTLLTTSEQLLEHFSKQLASGAFEAIRQQLNERCRQVLDDVQQVEDTLATAQLRMQELSERISQWELDNEPRKQRAGFGVLSGGLAQTYDGARMSMAAAGAVPSPEVFHEWRKRVKYHWHHCQLLKMLWPPMIAARGAEAKRLGDWLGIDHDLAVLHQSISEAPNAYGSETDVAMFLSLVDQRRQTLGHKALQLGHRLFAEKTTRFVQRQRAYWNALYPKGS